MNQKIWHVNIIESDYRAHRLLIATSLKPSRSLIISSHFFTIYWIIIELYGLQLIYDVELSFVSYKYYCAGTYIN